MKPHFLITVVLTVASLYCQAQSKLSLQERLIPGVTFQYHSRTLELLDVYSYLAYQVNDNFSFGVGWNHRFVNSDLIVGPSELFRVYGPRTFVKFDAGHGFAVQAESEYQKTFLPVGHDRSSPWVTTTMLGARKQVRVHKNFVAYGLGLCKIDGGRNYPYEQRTNFRFGIEYMYHR